VADVNNDRIQIFDSDGGFLSKFGSDGCGTGQFYQTYGVGIDPTTHNLFVAGGVCGRIPVFSSAGAYVSQFGTYGFANGQFETPSAVAIDPTTRNIVVADSNTNHVQIFNSAGAFLSQVGTPNSNSSPGTGNGQFNSPHGVAIDPATHNIVVTDAQNHRVQIFNSAGIYLSQFGSSGTGNGQFSFPYGVAIDPTSSNIVVADYGVGRVQVFTSAGLYLSQFGSFGSGNGQFENPYGVAIDPATHNVVIADQTNNRVQIFAPPGGTPQPQCTYALASPYGSATAAGGAGSVALNSVNGCAWNAASNVSWLHVSSGASSVGTGAVGYTVDPNTGGQRFGTITIAGQTYTVIQAPGAVPTPQVGIVGNANYSMNGGNITLQVDGITNTRSTTTGTLRLELWALTAPYPNAGATGYKIAQTSFINPLASNGSYSSSSQTVSQLTTPPAGTWYMVLLLTEYTGASTNDGFVVVDSANFSILWTTGTAVSQINGPMTGLWWNQNESGWGMSLTQHGTMIFMAWYSYDQSGTPVWYVMSSCPVTGNGCTGPVYKVVGGQALTSIWNGSGKVVSQVGTGTLFFTDNGNGIFNFTINGVAASKIITRQLFASGSSAPIDYTDLWWNPNESGWGVALTQQSGMIFATAYTYDAAGNAIWYVASSCPVLGNGCTGALYQVTGGSTPTAVWNGQNKIVTQVGTVSFIFSDSSNAQMNVTINGVTATKTIVRQSF
jgi:DNA-binding beta-propeller fold protein YncE